MDNGVLDQIIEFVREVFTGLNSGVLFFGGPGDIIRYILDILLITVVLYNLLRVLRETRAWQLLKGVMLIVLLTMVCSLLGLEMVSFIFNKILYIVALAFVVIFQPELRRALETVGLKSFSSISVAFAPEDQDPQHIVSHTIDEIVSACVKMGKSYTGALMILERNSRLSELMIQENAVQLDASVTDSMLQSIFYKGSPLHDGAILIRNGRIIAARCHIPLADNYYVCQDLGTRHRAAIGASEMGDAVAIVVSEERGTISVALDGNLYTMQSGDELRNNLRYLLGISETTATLGQRIKFRYARGKKLKTVISGEQRTGEKSSEAADSGKAKEPSESGVFSFFARILRWGREEKGAPRLSSVKKVRGSKSQRVLMFLTSLVISVSLWMYIQVTNNPIAEKTLSVEVESENADALEARGLDAYYPVATVTVNVIGRKSTMDTFSESDIHAYIDFSDVTGAGVTELPIKTESENSGYFRIEGKNPETLKVVISELDK